MKKNLLLFSFIAVFSFCAGMSIYNKDVKENIKNEPTWQTVQMQRFQKIQEKKKELEIINTQQKVEEIYVGTFDMSHYTNERGSHVPSYEGGSNDRKGNPLVAYESIAVPKKLYKHLPYGSKVKIVTPNGEVYYGRAVDTGGALNRLNRIDRCVSSYREATSLGVIKNVKIYKVEN